MATNGDTQFGESHAYTISLKLLLMMPKIVSKSHSTHVLETTPVKQKQKQRILCREYRCGTSQMLFEGQVRELSQLLSDRAGELCVTWFVRVLGEFL